MTTKNTKTTKTTKTAKTTKTKTKPVENKPARKTRKKSTDGVTKVMQTATLPDGTSADFIMRRAQVGSQVKLFADPKAARAWYRTEKAKAKNWTSDRLISNYTERLNNLDISKCPPWKHAKLALIMDAMTNYLETDAPSE